MPKYSLPERLRQKAAWYYRGDPEAEVMLEAADEIEWLRSFPIVASRGSAKMKAKKKEVKNA